jgi:hypothetical protein
MVCGQCVTSRCWKYYDLSLVCVFFFFFFVVSLAARTETHSSKPTWPHVATVDFATIKIECVKVNSTVSEELVTVCNCSSLITNYVQRNRFA